MENIVFDQFMAMDSSELELINGGWTSEQWIVGACTVAGAVVGACVGSAVGGPVAGAIGGKAGAAASAAAGVVISAGCAWVANKVSSAIIG